MEEILKILDSKRNMKKEEVYSLLKTNSQKINSKIFKKIKSFSKVNDFFNHYSNQTSLLELLQKIESNFLKNYDETFSSFDSNIEQYVSCYTQLIISLQLILKVQEILKKTLFSSKQYLSKLKIEYQIENISQENIFFFIENLLDISETKITRNFSDTSSIIKFDSSESVSSNFLYHQDFIKKQSSKTFSCIDIRNTLNLLNGESYTKTFCLKSDKNFENIENENYKTIQTRKDSSSTLSGEKEINSSNDSNVIVINKNNDSINKNALYNNSTNIKKYENLLEMINKIYRKCIINSEEKIRLKQLVIAKSKKIENLYYNVYKNKFIDENVLRTEITKVLS